MNIQVKQAGLLGLAREKGKTQGKRGEGERRMRVAADAAALEGLWGWPVTWHSAAGRAGRRAGHACGSRPEWRVRL